MTNRRSRKYDGRKLGWLKTGRRILLAILLLAVLLRFVAGFSIVSGISMDPTLKNGDIVFYTRLHGAIEKGDIVSVAIPSGEYYVKRVIAKAGDTVDLRDGTLYVNGEPETGSYIHGATYAEDGAFLYPYTISEGSCFVVGDNREESIDSRYFGEVSEDRIRGRLFLRLGWLYAESL